MEKFKIDVGNEYSLSDACREVITKFEENGINVDNELREIGGKKGLLQYAQDLDDDVRNDPAEVFKNAYENDDVRRCVRAIVNMTKKDWFLYKRGIRKVLYTEGNLFKNPLNYGFSQEDYEKSKKILAGTVGYLKQLSEQKESSVSKEMMETCNDELVQLYFLYDCMYNNRMQNVNNLNELEFLNYSLPQIMKSILVFYQSQTNYARKEMASRWRDKDCVTGVESLVASERASLNPDIHVSMEDSFELLIEDMDALFRYVYFLKKNEKEMPEKELLSMEFITPYESPDFQKLMIMASFDSMFSKLEASFRFSGWNIMYDKDIYYFQPSNDKPYKIHITAGVRNKYKYMFENYQLSCDSVENSYAVTDSRDEECLMGGFFKEYIPASKRMDLRDVEAFHFNKAEYAELVKYVRPIIETARQQNKTFYFTCHFNDINVNAYLDAYMFLYIFSKIYYCKAVIEGSQKDLVALVSLKYLYEEFSRTCGYTYDVAKKLIDCYVFDKKVAKRKKYGDIFTRPIIGIGSGMALLSEGLINQININRNIEVLLDWNNVNISPVGKALECRLIDKLKNNKFLLVNTQKVEFLACDGRRVEFDFIATIDDYLLLIEMKSLLQPYDDDELYRRKKTLLDGVAQIKRRVQIVQNDWDKMKEMTNIILPDTPYDESHIIKVVCTDINNYTSIVEEDVIISDESTVLKYFTNPYLMGVLKKADGSDVPIIKQVLWKDGKPTADEFVSYLRSPNTMDFIMKCIEAEWKMIPVFNDYKKVAFKDMVIKKDPIQKLVEMYC